MDSNHDKVIQSHLCYRYTTRQKGGQFAYHIAGKSQLPSVLKTIVRQGRDAIGLMQQPTTPTRLFEHLDEHSLSAVANALSCTPLKVGLASEGRSTTGLGRRRKHEDDFDAPGEGGFVVWIYLGLKMT